MIDYLLLLMYVVKLDRQQTSISGLFYSVPILNIHKCEKSWKILLRVQPISLHHSDIPCLILVQIQGTNNSMLLI